MRAFGVTWYDVWEDILILVPEITVLLNTTSAPVVCVYWLIERSILPAMQCKIALKSP